jgi:hypothetical protein
MNGAEEDLKYLSRIVGEQLTAVIFVMDYLKFQFNNCYLTALFPVVAYVSGQSYRPGDLHYRDSLCERIMGNVTGAILEADSLRIGFDDGASFALSLREEDRVGMEALLFEFREAGKMEMLVIHGAA